MTTNQLRYWELQEAKRSNIAKEGETVRSNLVREAETERSNKAKEAETFRHNFVDEGIRKDTLKEAIRHNKVGERQQSYKNFLETVNTGTKVAKTTNDITTNTMDSKSKALGSIAKLIG